MGKRNTKGIIAVAAATVALAGFGFAPATAAPARSGTPDLSAGTVDASAQRRVYRGGRVYGYRGYRGPSAVPFALGAAAVTAAGIAAASSYRRDYYYQPAPYGYYGGPGYAPYGGYGYGGCGGTVGCGYGGYGRW